MPKPRITAPLCQEAAVLAVGFGVLEEIVVEAGAGVEDLDADQAAVFPVQGDEPICAGRCGGLEGGAARRERVASEVDVDRVGGGVAGDPHVLIVPRLSAMSWW